MDQIGAGAEVRDLVQGLSKERPIACEPAMVESPSESSVTCSRSISLLCLSMPACGTCMWTVPAL